MEGFSYMGLHSSAFDCYYIPNETTRFQDKADFDVYDESPSWRNGGIYYGSRLKSRVFKLDCYFEQITRERKERLMNWLDRKTSGKLIFDERPFVYYNVRPTAMVSGKMYNHRPLNSTQMLYSGTFTVTFTCYESLGYLTSNCYEGQDDYGMHRWCGMIHEDLMPDTPTTATRKFNIYNPGTETCGCRIFIGGSATDKITIHNNTNNTKCVLNSLPPTTCYLDIDSDNGVIHVVDSDGASTVAYEYSEDGYVTLESCGFIYDDLLIQHTSGNKQVKIENYVLDDWYIGKYVIINKKWYKITQVSGQYAYLNSNVDVTGHTMSRPVIMNEIQISGAGLTLNKLQVHYTPRVQ